MKLSMKFFRDILSPILFLLLFFVILLGLLYLPVGIHNYKLEKFANNLFEYDLPKDTKILSSQKNVGLLVANGNHCDYEASIVIATKLNKAQLQSYFKSRTFPSAEKNSASVKVIINEILRKNLQDFNSFEVIILDSGYSPGLDYRCY